MILLGKCFVKGDATYNFFTVDVIHQRTLSKIVWAIAMNNYWSFEPWQPTPKRYVHASVPPINGTALPGYATHPKWVLIPMIFFALALFYYPLLLLWCDGKPLHVAPEKVHVQRFHVNGRYLRRKHGVWGLDTLPSPLLYKMPQAHILGVVISAH